MNLNTSSTAGAGAIDLKIASSGAGAGAWSIVGQLPSPGTRNDQSNKFGSGQSSGQGWVSMPIPTDTRA